MNTQVLTRPFATALPRRAAPPLRAALPDSDETIRGKLLARLATQPWWDAAQANVFVDRGTVVYQGLAGRPAARRAARELALAVAGVRSVWDARVPRREWQSLA